MVIRISSCSPILLARPPLTILVAARDFRNPLRLNNEFSRQFKLDLVPTQLDRWSPWPEAKEKATYWPFQERRRGQEWRTVVRLQQITQILLFFVKKVDFIFHPSQFRFGQREICLYSFLCASLTAWTSYSVATGEISIEKYTLYILWVKP